MPQTRASIATLSTFTTLCLFANGQRTLAFYYQLGSNRRKMLFSEYIVKKYKGEKKPAFIFKVIIRF